MFNKPSAASFLQNLAGTPIGMPKKIFRERSANSGYTLPPDETLPRCGASLACHPGLVWLIPDRAGKQQTTAFNSGDKSWVWEFSPSPKRRSEANHRGRTAGMCAITKPTTVLSLLRWVDSYKSLQSMNTTAVRGSVRPIAN